MKNKVTDIYYTGSETSWNRINKGYKWIDYYHYTIHYNCG